MPKENVLVFSGATYPAMQIIDCLKHSVKYHVIAASSYPNHSEYVCQDIEIGLPYIYENNFLNEFIKLVISRDIHFIIPTDESIALILKQNESMIPAKIVCSSYETTKLCRYKDLMYDSILQEEYCPKIYKNKESIEKYPVFIKPVSSQGSKGTALIQTSEELYRVENLDSFVISEYLPGEEYTIDCFTNRNRELVFCNPRIRSRIMNGITARGHDIPLTDEFKRVIEDLNKKIEFCGYWFVQLKRSKEGKLKLLEFSTRFAGSFAISKGKGINLPVLALSEFSDSKSEVIFNSYQVECDKSYIDRYKINFSYQHIYIDYDDTITKDSGKAINPYVISYLYQCKNKNKKIYLISRHDDSFDESIEDSLDKMCISQMLFDKIIKLTWKEKKIDFIENIENSIFIDNSFAERKQVHDQLGIPVFDVCHIDCLFDWRE